MNINMEINIYPEQMAQAFWAMDSDDQVIFFNTLTAFANKWQFQEQMNAVAEHNKLGMEAKRFMACIGESVSNNGVNADAKKAA